MLVKILSFVSKRLWQRRPGEGGGGIPVAPIALYILGHASKPSYLGTKQLLLFSSMWQWL